MANNRLYIVDTSTGDRIMIASTMGGGWTLRPTRKRLAAWLNNEMERDVDASVGNALGKTTLKIEAENGESNILVS